MVELKAKCGTSFFVDKDIAEAFGHLGWRLDKDGYVHRKTRINGKHGKNLYLHRVVMGATDPQVTVDHIDTNTLMNTRENLRLATKAESVWNRNKRPNCSSQFLGVRRLKNGRWNAQIKTGGKHFNLGTFADEHEAGHAYNKAAIFHRGEFARLNPVGHPNPTDQPKDDR